MISHEVSPTSKMGNRRFRLMEPTASDLRKVVGSYRMDFLVVPMRGWENRNGQPAVISPGFEFEAFHEQNASLGPSVT